MKKIFTILLSFIVTAHLLATPSPIGKTVILKVSDFFIPGNTWTAGGSTTDWNTGTNWSLGTAPVSTDNVIIPNIATQPTISVSTIASCNNITINTGATLTVTGTLQIGGSISNSGTIIATSGTITMNGSSAQAIPANTFSTNTIQNLTINNSSGVTLGGVLNVTGVFTPTSGTFNTGGYLTLKSTSITNTAMVGQAGGAVSGNVTVERYIPGAQRSFRFLSPGVTTSTSIHANWQEGATSSTNNPNPGYGTDITGNIVDQTNGFDGTATGNASLFTFNNGTQTWGAISNTNSNTLTAGQAYRILIRGDRSTNLTTNTPAITSTTLRATGTLKTGAITFSTITTPALSGTTNNYNFIGNPYWAPVDWTSLLKNHVSDTYYLWDPTRAGSNGRGAYVSYTIGTGGSGGGAINQYIQPGQAFFVQTTGASPIILFDETNKAVNSANLTTTFGAEATKPRLNIELFINGNTNSADATALVFDNNFSIGVGNEDANKFTNPDENIAINNNNTLLGLDGRPLPNANDTIQISTTNLLSTAYTLKVSANNFGNYNGDVAIIDKYTNQTYPIDKAGAVTQVSYNITTDAASSAANRFVVVFNTKTIATTITDPIDKFGVVIAGNPVSNQIIVNYAAPKAGNTNIRLVNENGQNVSTMSLGMQQQGQVIIPVKQYASGMYLVEVQIGSDTVIKKVMKN